MRGFQKLLLIACLVSVATCSVKQSTPRFYNSNTSYTAFTLDGKPCLVHQIKGDNIQIIAIALSDDPKATLVSPMKESDDCRSSRITCEGDVQTIQFEESAIYVCYRSEITKLRLTWEHDLDDIKKRLRDWLDTYNVDDGPRRKQDK